MLKLSTLMDISTVPCAFPSSSRWAKPWRCSEVLPKTALRQYCRAPGRRPLRPDLVPTRLRHKHASVAADSPSTSTRPGASPEQLVDELLDRIRNSGGAAALWHLLVCAPIDSQTVYCCADSGVGLQEEEEATVNKLINQLEDTGRQQVGLLPQESKRRIAVSEQLAVLRRNLALSTIL